MAKRSAENDEKIELLPKREAPSGSGERKNAASSKPVKRKRKRLASNDSKKETEDTRTTRINSDDLLRRTLSGALPVAEALRNSYAGKAATWEEIAEALGVNSGNPNSKYPLWSAVAYGIVKKDDSQYSLAEVGRMILAPEFEGEDQRGRLKAILTPSVLSKFYTEYNGSPLPADNIFLNVLENRHQIPRNRVAEAKQLILDNAREVGILEESDSGTGTLRFSLTGEPPVVKSSVWSDSQPKGDDHSPTELPSAIGPNICFVITPIGEDGSAERKHANAVLKHLIEPALDKSGLTVRRADKITKPGVINKQIVEHLAYSQLCIADLSFNNPNAFYEMGVRHAFKLPMIQIIRKGDRIPFDVAPGRTIVIDCTDPYQMMDAFSSARKELAEHVASVLDGSVTPDDEPMSVYLPGITVVLPKPPARTLTK